MNEVCHVLFIVCTCWSCGLRRVYIYCDEIDLYIPFVDNVMYFIHPFPLFVDTFGAFLYTRQ